MHFFMHEVYIMSAMIVIGTIAGFIIGLALGIFAVWACVWAVNKDLDELDAERRNFEVRKE